MTPEEKARHDALCLAVNSARQLVNALRGQTMTNERADRIDRKLREAQHILRGGKPERQGKRRDREAYRIALRSRVFGLYGGRCACCGESNQRALTIDHVEPLRGARGKRNVYNLLASAGRPLPEYQVLCLNCNQLKGTSAECPHKAQRPAGVRWTEGAFRLGETAQP